MQTLYIDVYFLINFTVNILALYFSAVLSKIRSSALRLIISAAIGAFFACTVVLLGLTGITFVVTLIISGILINLVFCVREMLLRRLKFFSAFMLFEALIGGLVNFSYSLLDKYLYPKFKSESFGAENRSVLLLALLILLAFWVIKLLFCIFKGSGAEKNISIKIVFYGKSVTATALIDSGNLATDPMSASPVVFVKSELMESLIGCRGNLMLSDDPKIKTRFRLIPVSGMGGERLFTGLRCDKLILENHGTEIPDVVIALDEEKGSYGGYKALLPSAIAEEI